ncbi:hypothetical protein LAZ67_2003414 [Cordylochernes scorpioides]|uniref:Endonuclease n=1 Tax=Cordylochernes scorpioides TaxID=51811 RepID=A0ABY6K328_9ARAC|nr:hypothetical protein LAZ67_2003414 [Cordylochernes scorpioides]
MGQCGKLQPVVSSATHSAAGQNIRRNSRLFVSDKNTGMRFLVDSGNDVSLIPFKGKIGTTLNDFKLYAANGTEISTHGTQILSLGLGLRRQLQWPFVIAKTNRDITRPNVGIMKANHDLKHFIITKGPPVFSRARPLDLKILNEAKQEFQFKLEHEIIRPSKSQWASPLHLITKKDGTLRPCAYFKWKDDFSRLDLFKAYYQIPIAEEDKPKTAIITPFGLYEFNVMSFGLRNAPATFQRFIHEILRGLDFTFPYLDDILVASETCEEHETHLKLVLEKLQNYGLRINIGKSILGVDQLEFLGHWITNRGSQPLPSKVQTILDYKLPTTKRELRTFLGMALHDYLKDSKKNDKRKIDWSEEAKLHKPDKESLHKLVSRTEELARRIDKMKSEETEIVETYKVNIKLPPFWIENTKFNYLIAQLEPKYVENPWDIITSKEINKYSEAKERLLRIFKDGESKRIRKLLSGIELGDLKPSQLLQIHVRKWSQACINCQKTKVSRHTKSEIGTFREPDERFSVIHIDLIGPLPPSNGKYYCLTCIDRYTSWMEVIPLEIITSETVALAFYNNWVSRFGTPYTIVSDQGRQFTSQVFKDLTAICGTKLLHTTPYHPQSNGKIERFNRTLKTAIKAHNSVKWTDSLPTILLALRAAIREDTGFSISQMVYGKTIKLPGEFFERPVSRVDSSLFISNLIEYMHMVKPIATNHNITKDIFIHKDLFKSDQVFLRINKVRKPLEPYYEGPYPVLEKSDTFFSLRIKNREVKISVDRLKPAYILGTPEDPIIPASREDPIIPASREGPIGPSSGPRPAKPGVRFELPKETRSGRRIKPPSKYNESIGRDFRHWKGSDVGDIYTSWMEVIPLENITSESVALAFYNNWVSRFGTPYTIDSDQGRQKFTSQVFKDLAAICGTKLLHTTPYHPQNLFKSDQVFLRINRIRKPLEPYYEGPYPVPEKSDNFITLKIKNREVKISIDRLKPAYILGTLDQPASSGDPIIPASREDPIGSSSKPQPSKPGVRFELPKETRSGRRIKTPSRYNESIGRDFRHWKGSDVAAPKY